MISTTNGTSSAARRNQMLRVLVERFGEPLRDPAMGLDKFAGCPVCGAGGGPSEYRPLSIDDDGTLECIACKCDPAEIVTAITVTQPLSDQHPWSDLGNARRLVDRYGTDLRYVWESDTWLIWNGSRWSADTDGEVMRRAHAVTDHLREVADAQGGDEGKKLRKFAQESQRLNRLEAMVKAARPDRRIIAALEHLDDCPDFLGVANGMVDLTTGDLRAGTRDALITAASPVKYDPDARAPHWTRFLAEVLPDEPMRTFVQRLIGYALTGHTREHLVAILHGTGANGKSVLVNTIQAMFGTELALAADFETFLGGQTAAYDLARFRGARLVTAQESGRGRRLDSRMVKQATGGDAITARHPYGRPFTYRPQFALCLVTNHRPKVDADDEGIWRRLALVPFEQSFIGRENRGLTEQLMAELPGILTWAVEGAVAWYRDGLQRPNAVSAATAAYRESEDTVGTFIADRCEIAPGARVTVGALREEYEKWAQEVGEKPLSSPAFNDAFRRRKLEQSRTGSARYWDGIALRGPQPLEGP